MSADSWGDLPELTPEERKAMESVDLTAVFGPPEEQIKRLRETAIRFFRERNRWRQYASYLSSCDRLKSVDDFETFCAKMAKIEECQATIDARAQS